MYMYDFETLRITELDTVRHGAPTSAIAQPLTVLCCEARWFRTAQHLHTLKIKDDWYVKSFQGLGAVTDIDILHLENLDIALDDFTGLTSLERLGELIINKTNIQNFLGLESVTSMGNVSINATSVFTSFQGLRTTTLGGLAIRNCNSLEELRGLENVTEILGDLIIEDNHVLGTLTGLDNLKRVGGNLIIRHNNYYWEDGLLNISRGRPRTYVLADRWPRLD